MLDVHELLRREEGFAEFATPDARNTFTIGYGHNPFYSPMPRDAAELMLAERVRVITAGLVLRWSWIAQLSEPRRAVIISMAYQLGVEGLSRFQHFLTAARDGDYDLAAAEMLRSQWAVSTPQRAERHAKQMATGNWCMKEL